MPRTIDADFQTHLNGHAITTTRCLKITRTDGEIFAFTELDANIQFDLGDGDGAVTYSASDAGIISAVSHVAGMQPDNFSIQGGLSESFIDKADIRNGLFLSADWVLTRVNWGSGTHNPLTNTITALTQDPLILGTGTWGESELRDNGFSAEMRPLTDLLNQRIGELVSPICRADLGDARCKVRLDPPVWQATHAYTVRPARDAGLGSVVKPTAQNRRHFKCTTAGTSGGSEPTWDTVVGNTTSDGSVVWTTILALSQVGTVSAVVDRANFTATGISLGADWWNYGTLEWLTGPNAGLKSEVKDDDGSGVLQLFLAVPTLPTVSDTFFVQAGCDKRKATCKTKFDNIYNRRAEDFVPGTDVALDYPDAS